MLHVHWKLPMVSVQSALTWQLSVSRSHSLTSARKFNITIIVHHVKLREVIDAHTHAEGAILEITSSAHTIIAAVDVNTVRVRKTDRLFRFSAFVDICRYRKGIQCINRSLSQ